VRAGCGDKLHVRFGGEGLVLLGNQDPASYPTGVLEGTNEGAVLEGGRELAD